MRRREFVTLLGGAAAAWPLAAEAQQSSIRPLVAVLSPLSAMAAARNINALRTGLRDLGYVDGRNVTIENRHAEGVIARLPALATELVTLNPDVIVAGSLPAVLALRDLARNIPVVMTAIPQDPTRFGLARSLGRPGGSFTGFWLEGDDALMAKRLELLKDAVPSTSRVGVVVNPDDPTDSAGVSLLPATARALNLEIRLVEVRSADQFEPVLTAAVRDGLQALCVSQSPVFNEARTVLAALIAGLRLPSVFGFREFAIAGGLMSYSANLPDIYRRAAGTVDKILKGTKPGDIPIERPTRFELVVNLKTAKALALAIPERFLLVADEVIE
jgi:putative tryptophan/tyrosine transport system substrate-binding protein